MSLGPWQIALIALVVILLFGAGKLPRLMGDAAKGINLFKKNLKDDKSEVVNETITGSEGSDPPSDTNGKDNTAKS